MEVTEKKDFHYKKINKSGNKNSRPIWKTNATFVQLAQLLLEKIYR